MFLSYRNYTGSCGLVKLYINILSRFDLDTFFWQIYNTLKNFPDETYRLKVQGAFLKIFTNWRL